VFAAVKVYPVAQLIELIIKKSGAADVPPDKRTQD
jgi:hypothetical protein